jgi:deazaflavin-dependent oxidoreductase (nitroreductase family)
MKHKYLENVRKFNRAIINRVTKLFAGKRMFSIIYHIGRKSGKEYSTPVVAVKNNDYIYVSLSYGTDTDWFRNIQTASSCKVKINGIIYNAYQPEVVNSSEIISVFSPFVRMRAGLYRTLYGREKVRQFLKLKIM